MVKKYLIMYNNIPVVEFDTENENARILHPHLIPFGEQNIEDPWDIVKSFCFDRIKLLLFDAFTLNTDRNRDNYALKKQGGVVTGMYPIFDHYACFRGKSLSGINIMTGVSFQETLQYLHDNYKNELVTLKEDIKKLLTYVKTTEFKKQFILLQDHENYNEFVFRIEEEQASS